ncbi:hypothetical protein Fcan01_09933 [Folsomia candida]|uniref:Uncharacterized protein n=1 Tax=Folsomia candida TaxID=158441 RepID=A0A226EFK1_FOLCA|nr:hypothetical protein Fcan01_09933 [Folsomia candida]
MMLTPRKKGTQYGKEMKGREDDNEMEKGFRTIGFFLDTVLHIQVVPHSISIPVSRRCNKQFGSSSLKIRLGHAPRDATLSKICLHSRTQDHKKCQKLRIIKNTDENKRETIGLVDVGAAVSLKGKQSLQGWDNLGQ